MKLNTVNSSQSDLESSTVQQEFLAAIPQSLRPDVRNLLYSPRCGGRGLRAWLSHIEAGRNPPLGEYPPELIEVYLSDDDAEPLHDCEICGLAVPVRCGWRLGHEPVAEREYFPNCPNCGGRTGRFAFWSRSGSFVS